VAEPILINGRFLTQPVSGVQRYAREILHALDQRPDAAERYRLVAPPGADHPELTRIPVLTVGQGGGHVWEQTALAWAARKGRLLSLCGSGPVTHDRQVVVIHDAAVFRRPEHFHAGYAAFHRALGRRLAARAKLATVSAFSRDELADVLRLRPDAIAVAPNGADHVERIAPDASIIARLGLSGRPYFVALGNLTPNKNIGVMVRALARLSDPDLRLVLIGAHASIFGRAAEAIDPRIILAGRRSDAEAKALLRGARALLFASLYEGFGVPPLEAFANDCPVIASDIPAVHEVCADAALHFDPTDDAALAGHMRAVLHGSDPARRGAGRARVAAYRWARSAEILDALAASTSR